MDIKAVDVAALTMIGCLFIGIALSMAADYAAAVQEGRRKPLRWPRVKRQWMKFRLWVKDLISPPCEGCSSPATVCYECAKHSNPTFIDAANARYCEDCQVYFGTGMACPKCGGSAWWPVDRVMKEVRNDKKLRAKREKLGMRVVGGYQKGRDG